ncbi:MAG: tRNA glutamyl-Q(34) synthetase GluQRS [Endozoicomonas sp. (ex Botrylloides leachii)]|nr:tRNA glutamyl-Q(34) synthetase GluQRS [Endozoicomonas sp. (ex Botrylloides leachii)]
MKYPDYIGRFAPSPSGSLHFGSLVTALASYLDARAKMGLWLVRIEDIDPPREQAGAASQILKAIETYGMEWDGKVVYQSNRHCAYENALNTLSQYNMLYPCICSRKKLSLLKGVYPNYCRKNTPDVNQPYALRLKCPDKTLAFVDLIQDKQTYNLSSLGDFILKRKDKLYAYQLAVSVDDAFQGVTHIVRGYDLLDSTPRQLYLQSLLNYPSPIYAHVPIITDTPDGNKLSKQNLAQPLPLDDPRPSLIKAMTTLGLKPDETLLASSISEILKWGIAQWDITQVPKESSIALAAIA